MILPSNPSGKPSLGVGAGACAAAGGNCGKNGNAAADQHSDADDRDDGALIQAMMVELLHTIKNFPC